MRKILNFLLIIVLTGCTLSIPDSGKVGYGNKLGTSPEGFARTVVSPPKPGSSPNDLVKDFFITAAGDQGAYSTSRAYLTPEIRNVWNPNENVRIYRETPILQNTKNDREREYSTFAGILDSFLDGTGRLYPIDNRQAIERFTFRKVEGEWRIASLSNGIALNYNDFNRTYRPQNIYYFDPTGTFLVPDRIYLSVVQSLANPLIRAVTEGPSQKLSLSVRSYLPQDISQSSQVTKNAQGRAVVNLTGSNVSSADLPKFLAQILWTLKNDDEIKSVKVFLNGKSLNNSLQTQNLNFYQRYVSSLSENSNFYALHENVLERYQISGNSPLVEKVKLPSKDFAISCDERMIASIQSDGNLNIYKNGKKFFSLATSGSFSSLHWDCLNNLWLVENVYGLSKILRIVDGKSVERIVLAIPRVAEITSFRMNREGVRGLVATSSGNRNVLYSVLFRPSQGKDTLFVATSPPWVGGRVSDMSWSSPWQLFLLDQKENRIWQLDIESGIEQIISGVNNPFELSAAPGAPLVVTERGGKLIRASSTFGWSEFGIGNHPSYPGG